MLMLAASSCKDPTNKPQNLPQISSNSHLTPTKLFLVLKMTRDDFAGCEDDSEDNDDGPCSKSLALRPSPP